MAGLTSISNTYKPLLSFPCGSQELKVLCLIMRESGRTEHCKKLGCSQA